MDFEIVRDDLQQPVLFPDGLRELVERLAAADMELHPGNQFRAVERLGDVIDGTRIQRGHHEVLVRNRREEKDRDVTRCRIVPELAAEIETRDLRHQHIQQDDVRVGGLQRCQRLLPACGGHHLVAVFLQQRAHHLQGPGLVIDDEHERGRAGLGMRVKHLAARRSRVPEEPMPFDTRDSTSLRKFLKLEMPGFSSDRPRSAPPSVDQKGSREQEHEQR